MSNITTHSVFRQIQSLYGSGTIAGLSDRQLVERFVTQARLGRRRRIRRTGRSARSDGPWHLPQAPGRSTTRRRRLPGRLPGSGEPRALHPRPRPAQQLALRNRASHRCKARASLSRQRKNEENRAMNQPEASPTIAAEQVAIAHEHAETLHAEIERLPGVFRIPVVLCYFEGLTLDQAALRLRCPAGTIHSRLVRAGESSGAASLRRGIIMPVAALSAALSPSSASASASSQLCETTARAAISFGAGQTAAPLAAILAREVLRSMMVNKFKLVSLTLFFVGAMATSTGYLKLALARSDEPKSLRGHSASVCRSEAGRHERKARTRSHVRRGSSARSAGQSRAGRNGCGIHAAQVLAAWRR